MSTGVKVVELQVEEFPGQVPDLIEPGMLTDEENRELAWILQGQGLPAANKYLEEKLGIDFEEMRERIRNEQTTKRDLSKEAKRVETAIEEWLATMKPGEYLRTEHNRETILAFLEANDLSITVPNLNYAWRELMAAGQLDEPEPPKRIRPLVGGIDPQRGRIEPEIRKAPQKMSAEEFKNACSQSKTFRNKMDATETPVKQPITALTDERKAELRSLVERMSAKQYAEFIADPENARAIEEL